MAIGRISKRTISALSCPAGKDKIFLWDDSLSGFGVAALASGKKVYVAQYRHAGRSRRVTIGAHGRLTPEQARTFAKGLLGDATRGIDVTADRRAARAIPRFSEIADEFMTRHVAPKRKRRTFDGYESLLRLHILPALGALRVTDIRRHHVEALHRSLPAKGAANRVLALTRAVLNYAARAHDELSLPPNPAAHIAANPEQGRERFLNKAEMARLGAALRRAETIGLPWDVDLNKPRSKHAPKPERRLRILDPFALAAIRLLLFTGARANEIVTAKWEWIDFERGFLNLPDSKTGRKTIVLSAEALEVLETLPRVEGNPFVIAGRDSHARGDLKRPWAAIRKEAGLEDVRLHDLRHSFASIGAGAGMGLPVIGSLLGHAQPSTTHRYAHFAADPVRRAADVIGTTIAAALAGKPAGA